LSRLVLALVALVAAGCAVHDRQASRVLADADAHAIHGDYPAAMAAYEAYLARYPAHDEAARARAARSLITALLATRAERDRLAARETELAQRASEREAELTRRMSARDAELAREVAARDAELARQVAARDAELARLRQELNARQAEVARLREDLEALKRTDLQMERRRR
jgi:predicted RNase H-like nuclease (RuvC/YqgF family)